MYEAETHMIKNEVNMSTNMSVSDSVNAMFDSYFCNFIWRRPYRGQVEEGRFRDFLISIKSLCIPQTSDETTAME